MGKVVDEGGAVLGARALWSWTRASCRRRRAATSTRRRHAAGARGRDPRRPLAPEKGAAVGRRRLGDGAGVGAGGGVRGLRKRCFGDEFRERPLAPRRAAESWRVCMSAQSFFVPDGSDECPRRACAAAGWPEASSIGGGRKRLARRAGNDGSHGAEAGRGAMRNGDRRGPGAGSDMKRSFAEERA